MTTMAGNDQQETHAPNPGEIVESAAQPAAPAQPEPTDVDDIELRDAKAAAQAEEAGKAGTGEDGKPAAAPAAQPGVQEQPRGTEPPAPIMIPKARLDEEIGKRTNLEHEVARLNGQLEATKAFVQKPAPAPAQPAAPQKTADERLAEVHAKVDALAAKFDAGELTYAQMKQQERTLASEEQSIREEQLLSRVKPQQPAAAGDPLYLDRLTADLEANHPYLAAITSEIDFNWLVSRAKEELAAENVPLKGDMGNYRVRERVAILSDRFGEVLTGKKIALPGAAQPSNGQPSADAQARAAKLNLATDLPPNLASMTGASQPGAPTDRAIESMSDDEIAALPKAVRDKMILGATP
jgi:hypothetical protein